MLKARLIAELIKTEGGDEYTDRPSDSGGPTRFGVTEKTARRNGYVGDMRCFPLEFAEAIYSQEYWDDIEGDALEVLSVAVLREVFDTGVNCGPGRAVRFLQRALNALSEFRLAVDGLPGPQTLAALQSYLRVRDESVLVKTLNCLQGAYYIKLTERREKDKASIYGWMSNRVGDLC